MAGVLGWMPTDSDIVEARKTFVRKLLARGLFDTDILDACGRSKLFRFGNSDGKYLERGTIRTEYLYAVKRELRDGIDHLDGNAELAKMLARLNHAYTVAASASNVSGMNAVLRTIAHTLGLRKSLIDQDPEVVEDPAEISEAMDDSVGAPDEE